MTYTLDNVGNRLQRNSTLPPVPATGLLNYDANDRTATDPYDANGNLLNGGVGTNVYDFENRLVAAGGVTLVYDGDGNRVKETVATKTTSYLVADQNLTGYAQVLDEVQGGAVSRTYSYGLSLIDQRLTANGQGPFFYGYDGHGSVRFLTDSTGAITDRYDYDAFGNLIAQTGATPNNYLFAGEQFDPVLGIYYNRARYYDQRQGRFWSMDTWEGDPQSPASLHRYSYVYNDPVLLSDSTGFTPLSDFVNQLNGFLRRLGSGAAKYTAREIGAIAHVAIESDIFLKLVPLGNVVLPEVTIPGVGRVDLIVNFGIYEIKPLGGTVDPNPQLSRYLTALKGRVAGTIPFNDFVSKSLIPLPVWVDLHYELTTPGVIEYDFRFDYKVLLPVLAYGLARVAAATYAAITELEWGTAVVVAAY